MKETGTIVRATAVLRVVAEADGPVAVKDVAQALGLPMSTSHRLLDLLIEAGLVQKDAVQRRYSIGVEFFRLSNIVTAKASLASILQPALDLLTSQTDETAIFAAYLPAQLQMSYAAKCDSPHTLRFRITLHQQMPLEWGASGLAILAFLPHDIQSEVYARAQPSPVNMKRLTEAQYFGRLAEVARNGFSFSESEQLPDSIGIGVPVRGNKDEVLGSIILTIPKVRYEPARQQELINLVKNAAAGGTPNDFRTFAA